jgi:hypothetical protein
VQLHYSYGVIVCDEWVYEQDVLRISPSNAT